MFVGRWTKNVTLSAGVYRFSGVRDDGIRVYLDNTLIVDKWTFGHEQYSVDKVLTSGQHQLRVEYFEAGGGAQAELDYDRIADAVPTDGAWAAQYFDNRDLAGAPVVTRTDDAVDFDWSSGSPADAVPANNFSARWAKSIDLAEAGAYKFTVTSDDGARLFIDGQRVFDKWNFHEQDHQHCQPAARAGPAPDRARVLRGERRRGGEAELRADHRPRSPARVADGAVRGRVLREPRPKRHPDHHAQRRRHRLRLGRRRPGRRCARGQLLGALDKAAERRRGQPLRIHRHG